MDLVIEEESNLGSRTPHEQHSFLSRSQSMLVGDLGAPLNFDLGGGDAE